jgi:hypothetical protein
VKETGLSKEDVAEMITAWAKNLAAAQAGIVAAGGYNQQLLYGDYHVSNHNKELSCGAFLREACQPVSDSSRRRRCRCRSPSLSRLSLLSPLSPLLSVLLQRSSKLSLTAVLRTSCRMRACTPPR